jgi:hypothetical protein
MKTWERVVLAFGIIIDITLWSFVLVEWMALQ